MNQPPNPHRRSRRSGRFINPMFALRLKDLVFLVADFLPPLTGVALKRGTGHTRPKTPSSRWYWNPASGRWVHLNHQTQSPCLHQVNHLSWSLKARASMQTYQDPSVVPQGRGQAHDGPMGLFTRYCLGSPHRILHPTGSFEIADPG